MMDRLDTLVHEIIVSCGRYADPSDHIRSLLEEEFEEREIEKIREIKKLKEQLAKEGRR